MPGVKCQCGSPNLRYLDGDVVWHRAHPEKCIRVPPPCAFCKTQLHSFCTGVYCGCAAMDHVAQVIVEEEPA